MTVLVTGGSTSGGSTTGGSTTGGSLTGGSTTGGGLFEGGVEDVPYRLSTPGRPRSRLKLRLTSGPLFSNRTCEPLALLGAWR